MTWLWVLLAFIAGGGWFVAGGLLVFLCLRDWRLP